MITIATTPLDIAELRKRVKHYVVRARLDDVYLQTLFQRFPGHVPVAQDIRERKISVDKFKDDVFILVNYVEEIDKEAAPGLTLRTLLEKGKTEYVHAGYWWTTHVHASIRYTVIHEFPGP